MILQTDKRLNSDFLYHEGCCIFSCLFILNKKFGLKLSPSKINIYVKQLKEAGGIDGNGNVVWQEFFAFFGCPIEIEFKSGTYKPKKDEYSIMKWHNERTNFSHFVVGTGKHVYFDPLGESVTCAEGKPIESRIIRFI